MPPSRRTLPPDPFRPGYHFLPPANWMNDPNGLIQWDDEYHLFYQYNPAGAVWGNIHWGHAVSKDLVFWEDLPLALTPTPGGPDADGCWTGCAVDNAGIPTLVYTSRQGEVESVCLATSSDDLRTWHKHPRNPVISKPPPNVLPSDFRDPYVWREKDGWYLVIGAGIPEVGGAALLYRSQDLVDWEYRGPLFTGSEAYGPMWECPNFFSLDDKYVLIIFPLHTDDVLYFVGDFVNGVFQPLQSGRVDHGETVYAPQAFRDARDRRLMFGWLREQRSVAAYAQAGWAGMMSLPRQLTLGPDHRLQSHPVEELQTLRGDLLVLENLSVQADTERVLLAQGNCLELQLDLICDAGVGGLKLCCAPDDSEYTWISYAAESHEITLDTKHASLSPEVIGGRYSYTMSAAPADMLKLHIFLDRSVIEVFTDDGQCLTARIYPTNPDSLGIKLFATGGDLHVPRMKIWQLDTIWPDNAA